MNSYEMQKAIERPVNRCSKKDIVFKEYFRGGLLRTVGDNDSYQSWVNSSWPLFPGGDLEMDHMLDLFVRSFAIEIQLDQVREKTNEEDIYYVDIIKSYTCERRGVISVNTQ